MRIDGGCHCGAVTYEAEIDPELVTICHCTDCQVMSGAPYRVVVTARAEAFTCTGELRQYRKTGDSGRQRVQAFCPRCGTHVYGTSVDDTPKYIGIRGGTVRQRDQLTPTKQIWCQSALPWAGDLASMPASDQQ